MTRILDIEGAEYQGVWRAWKLVSLGLFSVFVAVLLDLARTMRRIEAQASAAEAPVKWRPRYPSPGQ